MNTLRPEVFVHARDVYRDCEAALAGQIAALGGPNPLAPDFMIIGAPRSGTTFLTERLRECEGCFIPSSKELKFFSSGMRHLHLEDYLELFREGLGTQKGEASPSYGALPTSRIRLMHLLNPQMKVVYILRDPVQQLASACKHVLGPTSTSDLQASMSYVLSDGPIAHVDYGANLDRWLEVFPGEQFAVLFFDDLQRQPSTLLDGVSAFLGVELTAPRASPDLASRVNASWHDATLDESVLRFAHGILSPRLPRLRRTLMERFPAVSLPPWVTERRATTSDRRPEPLEMEGGMALTTMDGRFVYGKRALVQECDSLADVLQFRERGLPIGAGMYMAEAVAEALLSEHLIASRLYSLAHGDDAAHDLLLLREGYFGWNILFFRRHFFAARVSSGHMDLRIIDTNRLSELLAADELRCFDSLQDALDSASAGDGTHLVSPLTSI